MAPALPYTDLKLVMEAPQAVVLIVVGSQMFLTTTLLILDVKASGFLDIQHTQSKCLDLDPFQKGCEPSLFFLSL